MRKKCLRDSRKFLTITIEFVNIYLYVKRIKVVIEIWWRYLYENIFYLSKSGIWRNLETFTRGDIRGIATPLEYGGLRGFLFAPTLCCIYLNGLRMRSLCLQMILSLFLRTMTGIHWNWPINFWGKETGLILNC